jgi:type I restriction enzyme S subunit
MKASQPQKNIPNEWQQVKLGDIGRVSMCKRIFKKETLSRGSIPFYKISTFGNVADAFISNEIFEEYKKRYPYPKKGEILISASGTIGRIVVFDGEKAYFQDSNIVWISNPEDKVLNDFLKYIYKKTKWKSTDGGIISRLYNDDLRSIKFLLPPLPEQNRIVSILETWDKYIENLNKKIEIKKQIKKGLMQDLLTGKKRIKGFNEKWEKVALEDTMNSFSTGLNPRDNFKLGFGKNYYVTIKNISNGALDFLSAETIDDSALKLINKRSKLSKGDIIMSSIGNVGECYLLTENPKGWDINESVFCLKPNNKIIDSKFIYYVINNSETKRYFENNITGSSFRSIKMKELRNMPLLIPKISEQKEIAEILTDADKEIESLEKKLEIIKEQKRYLLNNLITGTIRTPENLSVK